MITIITQAIRFGIVFLYGSTGEILIEKSGHLNLGIPGIMCLGGVGGCMGAYWSYQAGAPAALVVIVAVLMAMLFGALGVVFHLVGFFAVLVEFDYLLDLVNGYCHDIIAVVGVGVPHEALAARTNPRRSPARSSATAT